MAPIETNTIEIVNDKDFEPNTVNLCNHDRMNFRGKFYENFSIYFGELIFVFGSS